MSNSKDCTHCMLANLKQIFKKLHFQRTMSYFIEQCVLGHYAFLLYHYQVQFANKSLTINTEINFKVSKLNYNCN